MKCINLTDIEDIKESNYFDHLVRVDNIYVASKVTSFEQIDYLNSLGVKIAIDLKGSHENTFNDKESFLEKGIEYIHFPITNIVSLTFDKLQEFSKYLNENDCPKVIYCGSGNRVGGLLAVHAALVCGHPKQRAYDFGVSAGMAIEATQKEVYKLIFNGDQNE